MTFSDVVPNKKGFRSFLEYLGAADIRRLSIILTKMVSFFKTLDEI